MALFPIQSKQENWCLEGARQGELVPGDEVLACGMMDRADVLVCIPPSPGGCAAWCWVCGVNGSGGGWPVHADGLITWLIVVAGHCYGLWRLLTPLQQAWWSSEWQGSAGGDGLTSSSHVGTFGGGGGRSAGIFVCVEFVVFFCHTGGGAGGLATGGGGTGTDNQRQRVVAAVTSDHWCCPIMMFFFLLPPPSTVA